MAAPCPAFGRRHPRYGGAGAQEGAEHVDVENLAGGVGAERIDPRYRAGDAGVEDEMGQAAQRPVDGREQAFDVFLLADIGLDRHGAAAGFLDVGHYRGGRGLVTHVVHCDAVSVGSGEPRGRSADAAARAGNENDSLHRHDYFFPDRWRRLRAASTLKASTAAANAIAK